MIHSNLEPAGEGGKLPKNWRADKGVLKFQGKEVRVTRKGVLMRFVPITKRQLGALADKLNANPQALGENKQKFTKLSYKDFEIVLPASPASSMKIVVLRTKNSKKNIVPKVGDIFFTSRDDALAAIKNPNKKVVCYPENADTYKVAIRFGKSVQFEQWNKQELLRLIPENGNVEKDFSAAVMNICLDRMLDRAKHVHVRNFEFSVTQNIVGEDNCVLAFQDENDNSVQVKFNKIELGELLADPTKTTDDLRNAIIKNPILSKFVNTWSQAGMWCASAEDAKILLRNDPELEYVVRQSNLKPDHYTFAVRLNNDVIEWDGEKDVIHSNDNFFVADPAIIRDAILLQHIDNRLSDEGRWCETFEDAEMVLKDNPECEYVVRPSTSEPDKYVIMAQGLAEIRIDKSEFYKILSHPNMTARDVVTCAQITEFASVHSNVAEAKQALKDRWQSFTAVYDPSSKSYTVIRRVSERIVQMQFTAQELYDIFTDPNRKDSTTTLDSWINTALALKVEGHYFATREEAEVAIKTIPDCMYAVVKTDKNSTKDEILLRLGDAIVTAYVDREAFRSFYSHNARKPELVHLCALEEYFIAQWQKDGTLSTKLDPAKKFMVGHDENVELGKHPMQGLYKLTIRVRGEDGVIREHALNEEALFSLLHGDPTGQKLCSGLEKAQKAINDVVRSLQDKASVFQGKVVQGPTKGVIVQKRDIGIAPSATLDSFDVYIFDPSRKDNVDSRRTKGLNDLEEVVEQMLEQKERIKKRPEVAQKGIDEALKVLRRHNIEPYVGQKGQKPDAARLKPGGVGLIPSAHYDRVLLFMSDPAEQSGIYSVEVSMDALNEDEFVPLMGMKARDMVSRSNAQAEEIFTEAVRRHVYEAAAVGDQADVKDVSLDELVAMFDSINFTDPTKPGYQDPHKIMNDEKYTSVEDARKLGIENFVTRIKVRDQNYYGTPQSSVEANKKYYEALEAMVKQTIVPLRKLQKEDPERFKDCILDLAIAGTHCGGRFVNATDYVYRLVTNQISTQAGVEEDIYQMVDALKLGIVDAFVADVGRRIGSPVDTNHLRNYVFTVIKELGVTMPGEDLIGMEDEYRRLGVKATQLAYETQNPNRVVKNFFLSHFTPQILADRVQEAMLDRLKNNPKFESILVGFFTDKVEATVGPIVERHEAAITQAGEDPLLIDKAFKEYDAAMKNAASEHHCTPLELSNMFNLLKAEKEAYQASIRQASDNKDLAAKLTKEHLAMQEQIMEKELAARGWFYYDFDDNFAKLYRFSHEAATFMLEQLGLTQNIKHILGAQGSWAENIEDATAALSANPALQYVVRQSKKNVAQYAVLLYNKNNQIVDFVIDKKQFNRLIESGAEIRAALLGNR